jgi:tRNA pseudouridine32 synthase/23S rRNA pseudouridine746 synthase
MSASNDSPSCFKTFKTAVSAVPLPDKFTYPFYYEPHELSRIATKELQDLLAEQSFGHNFGLEGDSDGEVIGKMFGVLVVKNSRGKLGYLSAFSGKVGNSNHHEGFVPPVFDMLQEGNFFLENMETLGEMNATVHKLENDPSYKALLNAYEQLKIKAEASIEELRSQMRIKKQQRKKRRLALDVGMNATERGIIENELIRESLHYKHQLKTLTQEWNAKVNRVKQEV